MRRLRARPRSSDDDRQRGSTLVLVLLLLMLVSMLAASLLFSVNVDLQSSRAYADSLESLNDLDSALEEVVWRLNLEDEANAPPYGSLVTVNSLTDYDARIDPDPQKLCSDDVDDNNDGRRDDPDELNPTWNWNVTILLSPTEPNPGSPDEVTDTDFTTGPPYGSSYVEPTIQASTNWRRYTESSLAGDVLTVRFKTDKDTTVGDSESDGEEIVFYDPELVDDGVDSPNNLVALGGDNNPDNDSPYNITWFDGGTTHYASGTPVLLVEATAKLTRGGRIVSTRKVRAEVIRPFRRTYDKGLCACESLTIQGGSTVDSYKSSDGPYDPLGLVYDNGNVGANQDVKISGTVTISGDVESGTTQSYTGNSIIVEKDATAGSTITGGCTTNDPSCIEGGMLVNEVPAPDPCTCDVDVDDLVEKAKVNNNNGNIITCPSQTLGDSINMAGTQVIVLTGGDYYFHDISVKGGAEIRVGQVADPTANPPDCTIVGPPTEPVILYSDGNIDLAGGGLVNGYDPPWFQIISSAKDTTNPPTIVKIAGDSDFYGAIYAPLTTVDLAGNKGFFGAALGKDLTNSGGAAVHRDEDLSDSFFSYQDYRVAQWTELE